jgi:hypothetical protein
VQVINNDLPTTLDSMERASLEFEELGQSLNGLTGGLRKKSTAGKGTKDGKGAPPSAEEGKSATVAVYEMNPVEAIQASTINSMKKVAHDLSSLTAVPPSPLFPPPRHNLVLGSISGNF